VAALVIAATAVFGCSDRSRAVNAGLRDRIHELEEDVRSQSLQIEELEIQLKATQTPSIEPAQSGHPSIPVVTRLRIDSTSGRRQDADDSGNRPLEVHLSAVDGRNRPVQLAGTIRIQVTLISEGQPPLELYSEELTPEEVRDAWRGGVFGGPTWLISVPLDARKIPDDTRFLDVDIFYDDLRTGERLICGDKVDIR